MQITKETMKIVDAASKESSRYAINGVHVSRSGDTCSLRATDGRRALHVSWDDDGSGPGDTVTKRDFECIIGRGDWADVGKLLNGRGKSAFVDESRITDKAGARVPFQQVNGNYCGNELAVEKTDGTFPDMDAVIPNRADLDCVRIAFNPVLMASTMKAIAGMLDEGARGCTIDLSMDPDGDNRPIGITAKGADGRDIRGVLMPVNMAGDLDDARKLYGLLRRFARQTMLDHGAHYIIPLTDAETDYVRTAINPRSGGTIPDSGDGGSDDESN